MQNESDYPPILKRFVRRKFAEPSKKPAAVTHHSLSVVEPDAAGYDPYNKAAPPPTEIQIEEMMRRRGSRKRRR